MDAIGGPGLLVRQAVGVYEARRFVGSNGADTPGSNSVFAFGAITHVAYAAPFKVLGGYWGAEVLVPVVYASVTTPVGSGSIGGVGDITFSPVVWRAPDTTVLGRPFFQFVDLDVVAPTGEYKSSALVTAGSNVWSFNPFYAFTWLLTDRFETSWRLHYLWNSVNNSPGPGYGATSIRPGQAVHFNGAASFAIVPCCAWGSRATSCDKSRTAEQIVSPCRARWSRWLRSGQGYLRALARSSSC
jgi:hypothetical protein